MVSEDVQICHGMLVSEGVQICHGMELITVVSNNMQLEIRLMIESYKIQQFNRTK